MIFESFIVFEVFGLRSSFSETGKLDLGTQKRPPLAYVTKKNQWILKYNELFERQMKKNIRDSILKTKSIYREDPRPG